MIICSFYHYIYVGLVRDCIRMLSYIIHSLIVELELHLTFSLWNFKGWLSKIRRKEGREEERKEGNNSIGYLNV